MAAEDSKIPKNLNAIESKLDKHLSDKQKQSLKVLPDAAGGDKLISPQAAGKFKNEIEKAKTDALAAIDSQANTTPLLNTIAKLKEFKSSFLKGKQQTDADVDKKRGEAERAKAAEEEKRQQRKTTQETVANPDPLDEAEVGYDSGDSEDDDEGF